MSQEFTISSGPLPVGKDLREGRDVRHRGADAPD